ncbi:PREDICTED: seleno K [Prunus dulcis]|uniref:PREDICTED: seleno K n=1 Tax=Prunus dulcis TaxID=3755 RepID=A0A5E4EFB3_PRUDU|nr:PREDICTED: seleno K [Prunus dulcis]
MFILFFLVDIIISGADHLVICILTLLGVVKSKRSIWRLKTITDFFWAIVNLIGVFFATMFSMEKSDAYRKGLTSGKKWDGGGPGGPGGGPYGGRPRGPPRGLDNVRGIDHSSLPACGSCCG